jgi:hypothetical protein
MTPPEDVGPAEGSQDDSGVVSNVRKLHVVVGGVRRDGAEELADALESLAKSIQSDGAGWSRAIVVMDNGERLCTGMIGAPVSTLEALGMLAFAQSGTIEGAG